jgi:transcriptional regulator with XRE-family HTH domain
MLKEKIGKRIKERRIELTLNQSDILDYIGISSKTLSNVEQGKANITLETLDKIMEILGLECDLFIKDERNNATS